MPLFRKKYPPWRHAALYGRDCQFLMYFLFPIGLPTLLPPACTVARVPIPNMRAMTSLAPRVNSSMLVHAVSLPSETSSPRPSRQPGQPSEIPHESSRSTLRPPRYDYATNPTDTSLRLDAHYDRSAFWQGWHGLPTTPSLELTRYFRANRIRKLHIEHVSCAREMHRNDTFSARRDGEFTPSRISAPSTTFPKPLESYPIYSCLEPSDVSSWRHSVSGLWHRSPRHAPVK